MWVCKERIVKLWKNETLRKLLIKMFPKFRGEEFKNLSEVREQILAMGTGCCVLIVEPTAEGQAANGVKGEGSTERMVFPLWKSIQSLNLMLPKGERKAMLLRLFNNGSDLVNLQLHPGGRRLDVKVKQEKVVLSKEYSFDDQDEAARKRNSSSPEPDGHLP